MPDEFDIKRLLDEVSIPEVLPEKKGKPVESEVFFHVRQIVLSMEKAARAIRLYSKNNEMYVRFTDDLFSQMTSSNSI